MSREHSGKELPATFLSHISMYIHRQSLQMEHSQTRSLYYAIHNDQIPLQKLLNGKNANNKVNPWSLELATYNITLKWISGVQNKAVDCLS